MIDVIITTERDIIVSLELKGHSSEYSGNICEKICFAVSVLTDTINLIDTDNVLDINRGNFKFAYVLPKKIDSKTLTLFSHIEVVVTALVLLKDTYPKSFKFTYIRRNQNGN